MSYSDKGEITREYYRKQGEARLLELFIAELTALQTEKPNAAWSPQYLIERLRSIYETRNDKAN